MFDSDVDAWGRRRRRRRYGPGTAVASCWTLLLLWGGGLAWTAPQAVASSPLALEAVAYATSAEAQAAWEPMRGSERCSLVTREGQPALRFPCAFAGPALERASWDRKVRLDLSSCQGVQFEVFCADSAPVSYFSLYFQSGGGWYHAAFFPESSTQWNVLQLDKATFSIEGQPAGWHEITAIRLSAWRATTNATEFLFRNLRPTGVLGLDAPVAVVVADSVRGQSPEEARNVGRFSAAVIEPLHVVGIRSASLSDREVTFERLRPAKLVILPYNPTVPGPALDALKQYAAAGGRLLAFYHLPPALAPTFGVQGGEHVRQTRPGHFAALRFHAGALPGTPAVVQQRSWNVSAFRPVAGQGRVYADWLDDQGEPTGQAAVLGSEQGLVMTHVLLSDDPGPKRQMLLAMAGRVAPELWPLSVEGAIQRIGRVADFASFDELTRALTGGRPLKPAAAEALASARALRVEAQQLAAGLQPWLAFERAEQSAQRALEAFCLAQTSVPGEFRAFWCHSAFGVEGLDWDAAMGRLAANGFTAVVPNMLWGGVAFYESRELPVAAEVQTRGDQIARCVAAARKHGLQVHVWKVNWNLGSAAPPAFVARMRQAGRLQANAQGKEEPWLCPSHPENQRLEIDSMVEVARQYDVDGLHFDYIRFPDGDHCFCAGCRQRFSAALAPAVVDWPKDILAGGVHRAAWLEWRRGQITPVVQAVAEQARGVRPGLRLSAAVFPNWASDRDTIGQDWKLWCERGYLDFVCPMDYTTSTRNFRAMVTRQLAWAGRVPCYPGIGPSAASPPYGADRVIEQILVTRAQRTGGFVIFNYGRRESDELLPWLGRGITSR